MKGPLKNQAYRGNMIELASFVLHILDEDTTGILEETSWFDINGTQVTPLRAPAVSGYTSPAARAPGTAKPQSYCETRSLSTMGDMRIAYRGRKAEVVLAESAAKWSADVTPGRN
ncbi:hypothetical protein MAPG_11288 [Magnaporthiopsis poae ATCC 64411]|uniref:Uncharacterized protein n=1 Tax=Magnaporthiopsis poae (strain ATCC 64411 / 73-15) TaxID=644358 RepID=A0A0C4EEV6_MAGP6|nr:hypothetical protein MAPG_11288 [Magnaporthiopsis poae ATCC 64411]